jgi:hypothetical protein
VHQGERWNRKRLDPLHSAQQGPEHLGAFRRIGLLEDVDVGAAREHVALGAPDHRPRIRPLDLVEALVERPKRVHAEEVEWRVVEDQHGDVAVALEPNGVLLSHRHLESCRRSA